MDRLSSEPIPPELRAFLDAFAEILANQALAQLQQERQRPANDRKESGR